MTHARAWLALFALSLVTAVAIVVPAQAGAFVSYYNCIDKPTGQWCDGRANGSYDGEHSWDYNQASNPGGGSFHVCQRLYHPPTGTQLAGAGCTTNWAANYYGDVQCVCYDAEIGQNSGSPKSINGFADAAW